MKYKQAGNINKESNKYQMRSIRNEQKNVQKTMGMNPINTMSGQRGFIRELH